MGSTNDDDYQPHDVPILVIEDNADHHLLIGYGMRASVPRADPWFVTSAEEALVYLTEVANRRVFPRLVLLDLYLPTLEEGWQLLSELKRRYPFLPVLAISADSQPTTIKQAYQLGACWYLNKLFTLADWESQFRILRLYCMDVATLSLR